jgi:hypothetical protein
LTGIPAGRSDHIAAKMQQQRSPTLLGWAQMSVPIEG